MTTTRRQSPRIVGRAILRTVIGHRLSGHAAEIAFYALLALIPATVTVGGILHILARVLGPELAGRGENAAVDSIRLIIGPKLADSVVGPFVRAQLAQEEGGQAIGGLLLTWWLFSRLFYAIGHGLDVAYGIQSHRRSHTRRLIALAHAILAVVAVAVALAVMALGWHGGSSGLGRWVGSNAVVALAWRLLRWPALFALTVGLVVLLYRYSSNVKHTWRQCLPGAVVAVLLWLAAGIGFRAYLFIGAGAPTGVSSADARVTLIGRAVGSAIATAVFCYVSALVLLVGAELNAEIGRRRETTPP